MDLEKLKNLITISIKYKDQGHWESQEPMDPENNFGFLYCVCNKNANKYYIGMKQYKRGGKKTRARKVKGKTVRKTNEKYGTPSNWKDYTTSSEELKKDFSKDKKVFAFLCIKEYKTKGGLVYAEANLQHKLDVMISVDKKTGEKLYYNKAVAAIRFVPKEHYIL